MTKKKLVRITTVPISLDKLFGGQLAFMNSYYEVIAVSSEKDFLESIGRKEVVNTFHIEMTRKITPLQDLQAVWKLFCFLKKAKPYIVHSHTPKAGIVGMIAAKLAGVPNRLHTVAGLPLLESKGMKRRLLNFVERLTYSCATKVYPNSNGLNVIIQENKFCKPEKLKVLANGSSNGIDVSYFDSVLFNKEENLALRKELNLVVDDFVFIFVGRLVADKGINELIAAFQKLSSEMDKVKLVLVGFFESDLDPLLPETHDEIATNKNIISVGFQKDVRPYFAISQCLVFPSYREGFPNVVMQAAAMGLPSIVTDINGCNEIIVEGKNGVIIPVKDSDALYASMKNMMQDSDLRTHLQQNARAMIVFRYEQQVVWEAILAEYKSLELNV